jgi:hypothetical protein
MRRCERRRRVKGDKAKGGASAFPRFIRAVRIYAITWSERDLHMTEAQRENLIRQYAAGDLAWSTLREKGFDNYLDVLWALGSLGLRPPIAPMDGPNVEARVRARTFIREALKTAS